MQPIGLSPATSLLMRCLHCVSKNAPTLKRYLGQNYKHRFWWWHLPEIFKSLCRIKFACFSFHVGLLFYQHSSFKTGQGEIIETGFMDVRREHMIVWKKWISLGCTSSNRRHSHGRRKYGRVTPLLQDLHWMSAPVRIKFLLAVLVFRCRSHATPVYLARDLHWLPTASAIIKLIVPRTRTRCRSSRTVGDRAFGVAAARFWNNLPLAVSFATSLNTFKKHHSKDVSYSRHTAADVLF